MYNCKSYRFLFIKIRSVKHTSDSVRKKVKRVRGHGINYDCRSIHCCKDWSRIKEKPNWWLFSFSNKWKFKIINSSKQAGAQWPQNQQLQQRSIITNNRLLTRSLDADKQKPVVPLSFCKPNIIWDTTIDIWRNHVRRFFQEYESHLNSVINTETSEINLGRSS